MIAISDSSTVTFINRLNCLELKATTIEYLIISIIPRLRDGWIIKTFITRTEVSSGFNSLGNNWEFFLKKSHIENLSGDLEVM